jgi:hypothetical protein
MLLDKYNLLKIYNQQVNTLLQKSYPKIAKMSQAKFVSLINPLKDLVCKLQVYEVDIANEFIPFVMVVS